MKRSEVISALREVHRPLFIVMVGVPGSGKSFFVNELARCLPHKSLAHLSTDDYDARMFKQGGMMKLLDSQIERACMANQDVIVDQTSMTVHDRMNRLRPAYFRSQYFKVCVDMLTPLNVCNERMSKRKRKVPLYIIEMLHEKYQVPTKDEGFDAIYTIVE